MTPYDFIVEVGNLLWGGSWNGAPVPPMTAALAGQIGAGNIVGVAAAFGA